MKVAGVDLQNVTVELPDAILDELVDRVVERLGGVGSSEFVTVAEAAELIRAKPQRVHDLLSAGRLERFKEGGRTLVRRADCVALVLPDRLRCGSRSGIAR